MGDFAVQYKTGANKYKRILKEILAAEVHTSFSLHSHQYPSSHTFIFVNFRYVKHVHVLDRY